MQITMQFQKDAKVMTANGQQVGKIERVVLNPETKVVTHIIVSTGSFFNKEDKVVPIGSIAKMTKSQITLNDGSDNLQSLPDFREKRYAATGEDSAPPPSPSSMPSTSGTSMTDIPITSAGGQVPVTRVKQNIPRGAVAVREGANIVTSEGIQVGNIEGVVTNAPEEQATHLLISKGMLKREKKLIPITWVERMGEDDVHLQMKKDSFEELIEPLTDS